MSAAAVAAANTGPVPPEFAESIRAAMTAKRAAAKTANQKANIGETK